MTTNEASQENANVVVLRDLRSRQVADPQDIAPIWSRATIRSLSDFVCEAPAQPIHSGCGFRRELMQA
jgi:hypothetical protein